MNSSQTTTATIERPHLSKWVCMCQDPPVLLATYDESGRVNIKARDRYWHVQGNVQTICPKCGTSHVLKPKFDTDASGVETENEDPHCPRHWHGRFFGEFGDGSAQIDVRLQLEELGGGAARLAAFPMRDSVEADLHAVWIPRELEIALTAAIERANEENLPALRSRDEATE